MMKRRNKTLLQAALTLLLAAGCAGTVAAQQPHYGQPEERIFRSDTVRNDFGEREVLHRLDSLASWSRHYVDYRVYEPELESSPARPVVPMSSVVVITREQLPRRVHVIDNMTLLGPRFMLSNGQASNWGPYPIPTSTRAPSRCRCPDAGGFDAEEPQPAP